VKEKSDDAVVQNFEPQHQMALNDSGKIADECWWKFQNIFQMPFYMNPCLAPPKWLREGE